MVNRDKLFNWVITKGDNLFVILMITLLCPEEFLKHILQSKKKFAMPIKHQKACLTISFDCDYPRDVESIPEVLKIFDPYGFKTSFACVGHWIEKYPDEHKMILNSGHEIVNHTYSHPDNEILNPGRRFKDISRTEKKEEVERCHAVCKKILNYEPTGCRIPHFRKLFSADIYGILKELNYNYSSSTLLSNTKSAGFPFEAESGVYEFPLTTCPKHPFTVFDTWHSLESKRLFYKMIHNNEKEYVMLFKKLISMAIELQSYINIYIDPYDIKRIHGFKQILDLLKERNSEINISTYEDIFAGIKGQGEEYL